MVGILTENRFQLKVPSDTGYLDLIREFVNRVAMQFGFNEEARGDIEIAVDEACTNIIKHAYQYNSNKSLDITLFINTDKLTVSIIDYGSKFNPKIIKLPDIKEYIKQKSTGGYGVYLMRTLMDKVEYEISDEADSNKVILIKYKK